MSFDRVARPAEWPAPRNKIRLRESPIASSSGRTRRKDRLLPADEDLYRAPPLAPAATAASPGRRGTGPRRRHRPDPVRDGGGRWWTCRSRPSPGRQPGEQGHPGRSSNPLHLAAGAGRHGDHPPSRPAAASPRGFAAQPAPATSRPAAASAAEVVQRAGRAPGGQEIAGSWGPHVAEPDEARTFMLCFRGGWWLQRTRSVRKGKSLETPVRSG